MPPPASGPGVPPSAALVRRVFKVKICLVGEEGVGKTSTIRRFVDGKFSEAYKRTIGTSVSKKTVELENGGDAVELRCLVYDIVGDHRFLRLFREAYFQHARGVVAVCDLTRPETLRALYGWIDELRDACGAVPVVVLGNKADLGEKVRVQPEDLEAIGRHFGATALATSARTGEHIEDAFEHLSHALLTRPVPAEPF